MSEKKTEHGTAHHAGDTADQLAVQIPHSHVPKGRLSESAARAWEDELRGRLGLAPLDEHLSPRERKIGWIITVCAGILAAFTRFFHLSHPHQLIFDETYYVKGAYSLLHHGFEGTWAENSDSNFASGDYSALDLSQASYVVHPPLGKWIMAIGQALFSSDSSVGWRFSGALIGVLAVMLIVRISLRLFRSPLLASVAGFAMALDGMGITMSRTGLLDNILAFFILLGFWAILRDREYSRARLAHSASHGFISSDGRTRDVWGPSLWYRPWLLVAAVFLGCATGVKWSGIYAVAVFGILVFVWGMMARKAVGAPLFIGAGVFREGIPAFIQLVPLAIVTYIACWIPWFVNPHSWDRNWAQTANPNDVPISWAPDTINSFLHYHGSMWDFHHGLDTPHTYQSQAWAWIVQARPVSFYWKGTEDMSDTCPQAECVQAISSIGNIAVWWLGAAALIGLIVLGIRRADWRAGAIGAGYVAVWAPWFAYSNRTIFQFYAIALLPFVTLALAWAIGAVTNTLPQPHSRRTVSPAELLAGKEQVWQSGVITSHSFDNDECLPDFPQLTDDDAPQAERPLPSATEQDKKTEDSNIYARFFTRLRMYAHPASSGGEGNVQQWWHEKVNGREYMLAGVTAVLIGIVAILWYPLWFGSTISYDYWNFHMWFNSWI